MMNRGAVSMEIVVWEKGDDWGCCLAVVDELRHALMQKVLLLLAEGAPE